MAPALATTAVSTVTTADDGWYRDITSFARHTAWLHGIMSLYTVGAVAVLVLMACYAWWSARARADRAAMAAVAWIGIGTVVSVACGLGLKQVFKETRPCLVIHVATVQACPGATDYSFPSDHTIISVALAVGLLIYSRKLGAVAAIIALVEGFSRIYLGQHYPHDVFAAIVVSTVIMLAGWVLLRGLLDRLIGALEATPLRPLLTSAGRAAAAGANTAARTEAVPGDAAGKLQQSGRPLPW
ncbi:phosphatase PAP2 family protein [Actinospica sp. MGRD01-02]|uniref:Phosphatase PAP2 family protein n=1 Tax=Actinospica acidithermotolerans TaxID=2828514 RepID=A0A941IHU3_9ACTN|nr:phosphatase PAP2 family protein [Actinospica acidithermotolerans]MBR7827609.1 phosphatase PAP2 family protein [Actinospica acidithermotolerans]